MQKGEHAPLPWRAEGRPPNVILVFSGETPGNRLAPCFMMGDGNQEANAEFICRAVNSHASLTRENEELKAREAGLVKALEDQIDIDVPEGRDSVVLYISDVCIANFHPNTHEGRALLKFDRERRAALTAARQGKAG